MRLRLTNQMVAHQTLRNLNASLARMDRYHQQLSTGKRVGLPSDDPAGTEMSMRLRTSIFENEQYMRNVDDGSTWLVATDSALNQALQNLHRARDLTLYAANGTASEEERRTIAVEVNQLLEDAIQTGNSKQGDLYLFAGENTLSEPFVATWTADGSMIETVTYKGTTGDFSKVTDPEVRRTLGLHKEIGPGITMRVGIFGDTALMPAIDALLKVRDAMNSGDVDYLAGKALDDIDEAMDRVLTARAEVGARANRLELISARLEEMHIHLSRLLAAREDIDVAETIMHLKMEETTYRLALSTGARVIQPTLMDFLR